MNKGEIKIFLDEVYEKYGNKRFIEKDPIKYVYIFKEPEDMEIVGFIASTLSLGRIDQIFKAIDKILSVIGKKPKEFFMEERNLQGALKNFSYRFFTQNDIEIFFKRISWIVKNYGRIKNLFLKHWNKDKNMKNAIHSFVSEIGVKNSFLLPDPIKGSPCKRLNMFIRWMVRRDDVDTGLWREIETSNLIIPLDTHVSRIGRILGLTNRKPNDWKAAEEITNSLKEFDPEDPLKYDFPLCRAGIEGEARKFVKS